MSTELSLQIQPKRIFRGQNATFRLTVLDENGLRFDLTGATLHFRVATAPGATPDISKSSAIVTEISILAQTGTTLGQADVFLVPADTDGLLAVNYVYDAWLVKATLEEVPIVPQSRFIIDEPVTDLP